MKSSIKFDIKERRHRLKTQYERKTAEEQNLVQGKHISHKTLYEKKIQYKGKTAEVQNPVWGKDGRGTKPSIRKRQKRDKTSEVKKKEEKKLWGGA